jgi:hypothetical protein
MECDMKKLPDKAEIVEQIIDALGPLRKDRSKGQASAEVERAIKALRVAHEIPRADAGSIAKHAKNLLKALEPGSYAMPVPLKGCDRKHMSLGELRSALDYLGYSHGRSSRYHNTKYCAAIYAFRLVNNFSQKPPSTTFDGQVRDIGSRLYFAITGEKADLKRQVDDACRNGRHENEILERARQWEERERQGEMIVRPPGPVVS